MAWIDDLLKLDDQVVQVAKHRTMEHECRFLSSLLGQKVTVRFKQIGDKTYKRIAGRMTSESEDVINDNCAVFAELANEMMEDRSILTNEALQKKLGAADPNDLILKLFPGTELADLGSELMDIQEYKLEQVTEDKKKSEN